MSEAADIFPKRYWIILICFLLLITRQGLFMMHSGALGWDGYYYLMQVKSILDPGPMQAPDYSMIYAWLLAFRMLIPDDVTAYQWGVAGLSGLFALGAFRLLSFYTHKVSDWLLLASLLLFSPTLLFLTVQFPKNLLGLALLLFLQDGLMRRNWITAVLLLIACFFAHRLSAGLGLFLFIAHLLFRGMRLPKWMLIGTLGLIVAGSFLLPGIFHFSDLERFQGSLAWDFQPLEMIYGWESEALSYWWGAEVWILYITGLCLFAFTVPRMIYKWNPGEGPDWRYVFVLFFLVIPIWEVQPGSMGYRFFLSFLLLMVPAVSMVMVRFPGWLTVSLTVLLLGASTMSWQFYRVKQYDPPYETFKRLSQKIEAHPEAGKASLIIAHKGLAEVIIYQTDLDALNWVPEYKIAPQKVWRVVTEVQPMDFNEYLSPDERQYTKLSPNHTLIREDHWNAFLSAAREANDKKVLAKVKRGLNPDKVRPAFLVKGRPEHE